ncbi:MAG: hypothetical protein FJX45_08125 [Alphaproteobacteria bacterium]|nr:hypothetical protein [Alphaproteobacteria bacterium]MBM3652724.1 hypothetical protein [Alphaproteobacteria bacterium]
MNKLLIGALALGAIAFVTSATSAPALGRLAPHSEGVVQKADDRRPDQDADRGNLEPQADWWGRGGPSWRDSRPWSDDEWRRNPDWDEKGPGPDED